MTDKNEFIDLTRARTKKLAVDTICFCDSLKKTQASSVIIYQLVKAVTSIGANYRAVCNARSKKEFFSKFCIVVEETEETVYWLELIKEASLTDSTVELDRILLEVEELLKIFSKARNSTY